MFDNIVQRASNPSQAGDEGFSGGEAGRRLVTMYRNGFSVDDGPLRDLESPESRAFLASLERGEAPVGTYAADLAAVSLVLTLVFYTRAEA